MRILHTSDWHLGRAFHGVDMLPHQAAFLDHLVDVVESHHVDVVVVSGDIYDRGLPPINAVSVASSALNRFAASRARVILSSGNHDSARRLGFAADLIARAGIHFCTSMERLAQPIVIDDDDGPVAFYGIPYLDPDVCKRVWKLPTRSHEATLGAAMSRIQSDLTQRSSTRSVVLAHAFVAGGQPSDSERDIAVGGIDRVPVSVFQGIDYVALGHLHGQQTLQEHVRYSGSPLAYSFSEAGHRKGSWLVDIGADEQCVAEFIAAPVPRQLAIISGSLDDVMSSAQYNDSENSWVQATLTDEVRPLGAMDTLRRRFPHALSLSFAPRGTLPSTQPPREGITDRQLIIEFVEHARGSHATTAEITLIDDALAQCCGDVDVDVDTAVNH